MWLLPASAMAGSRTEARLFACRELLSLSAEKQWALAFHLLSWLAERNRPPPISWSAALTHVARSSVRLDFLFLLSQRRLPQLWRCANWTRALCSSVRRQLGILVAQQPALPRFAF